MGRGGTLQTPAPCGMGMAVSLSPPCLTRWMTGKRFITLAQRRISCPLAWSMGEVVLRSAPQRPQTSGESLNLVASTGLISTYTPCMALNVGCKHIAWLRTRGEEGISLR